MRPSRCSPTGSRRSLRPGAGQGTVDANARDAFLETHTEIVEAARTAHGCLDVLPSADPLDPGRVNVYERWESTEDVERFRGSGPSGETRAQILKADVAKYEIAAVAAP
jgi:quinol monooxygenase YgiN